MLRPCTSPERESTGPRSHGSTLPVGLLSVALATGLLLSASAAQAQTEHAVTWEGTGGPGEGLHVVLISGDHEYRSEELLPAWGRILAGHYGFTSTVFFTLDDDGYIEPGSSDIDGLEVLADADLLILATRFQDFPDHEMRHIVEYLERGGPVVGIRTATHAFAIEEGPYRKYTWNYTGQEYEKGFGRQVLGETWAGHYGTNHQQSSRVLPVADQADHPILRGVRDMHVLSGGYEAHPLEPFTTLAVGEVLNGMEPDARADPTKERMPVVWVRHYTGESGQQGRVFTTTHGASVDFLNPGFRRLLINASLWAVGLEDAIDPDSDISFEGQYHPVDYAFDGYRRGVRPSEMAGWETPIMPPDRPTTESGGPGEDEQQ